LDLAAASDGFQSPRQSEWRFNVVTNYSFDSLAVLKGWSIGGAVRWADAPVIGYANTTLNGNVVPDVSNPYYGRDIFNVDAWLKRRVKLDGKRFVDLRLNVKNVLGADDLVPQRATSTGIVGSYQAASPRLYIFEASLSF
jgi:hypothetical protein